MSLTDQEKAAYNLTPCCGESPRMREGDYYESDPDLVSCRRCGRYASVHGLAKVAKAWNETFATRPDRGAPLESTVVANSALHPNIEFANSYGRISIESHQK